MRKLIIPSLALLLLPGLVAAAEVKVAVASNFLSTIRILKSEFEKDTGHKILLSAASTGKLYAQITHGAPFEVLLAADSLRPQMAEENGLAVPGSRYTYASGRLTLWSATPSMVGKECLAVLNSGQFRRLAIANPKTAPYGEAAKQALKKMGLWADVKGKLVRGENIGQTFQYTHTRNAELGMIALSQALDPKNKVTTCRWDVPVDYYEPLEQDLVVLKKGAENPAVSALIDFLKSDRARKIIAENGYGV